MSWAFGEGNRGASIRDKFGGQQQGRHSQPARLNPTYEPKPRNKACR